MSRGWTIGMKCRVSELDLQHLFEAVLASDLVRDLVSLAPADGAPFSTNPVEHLLQNGYAYLETVEGREVEVSRGMLLGGFRDWAERQVERGKPIPACLCEISPADRGEILEAALHSPKDLSDYYQVDLPFSEGVRLIFLDRQTAYDRFMALCSRYEGKMLFDDWAACNHMIFETGDSLFSLTGRRFSDDFEEGEFGA